MQASADPVEDSPAPPAAPLPPASSAAAQPKEQPGIIPKGTYPPSNPLSIFSTQGHMCIMLVCGQRGVDHQPQMYIKVITVLHALCKVFCAQATSASQQHVVQVICGSFCICPRACLSCVCCPAGASQKCSVHDVEGLHCRLLRGQGSRCKGEGRG